VLHYKPEQQIRFVGAVRSLLASSHDQMIVSMQALITRIEAAKLLSISVRSLDSKIASGDIPVVRIGRSVRIRPEALERFVDVWESRIKLSRKKR
jgi:excisionase family DNA binding protein